MNDSVLPEFSDEAQQGFGDVTLTVDYALPLGSDKYPIIRTQFYTKLPTADENKGLGTGATDYGVGLSAGKILGSWLVYTKAMYIFTGSATDYRLENYWTWLASGDYAVTNQLLCGIELSGATSPFESSDNVLDLRFNSSYRYSNQGSLGTYVAAGLSEGSADYGLGIYATVVF
jgi:hypothetical protein